MTQPFITVVEKYSSSDVIIILFTDENIYSEKPVELPIVHICANQGERRGNKTPAYTVVQSVTDGISRRVASG